MSNKYMFIVYDEPYGHHGVQTPDGTPIDDWRVMAQHCNDLLAEINQLKAALAALTEPDEGEK